MKLFGVLCILAVEASTPTSPESCHNVQLNNFQPCTYQTSDCLEGGVQWNYPEHLCEWTFSPRGATSMVMSATWATALGVNLTFFDGSGPGAKQIGYVEGLDKDQTGANVTSRTGTVVVKLSGPDSMVSYALIFDYTITPKQGGRCAAYNGDCVGCLNAGCSMGQGGHNNCVNTCPQGQQCWQADKSTTPEAVCSNRQTATDPNAACSAKGTCAACQQAGCQWGGAVGAVPSCLAKCDRGKGCMTMATCPDTCSKQKTCENCLNAGCSMMGLTTFNCVRQCPTDIPCFTPGQMQTSAQTCQTRKTLVDKTAFCKLQTNCNACMAGGCQWNMMAVGGNACVTGCGFEPCQLAAQCGSSAPLMTDVTVFANTGGGKSGKRKKHNLSLPTTVV